MATVTSDDEVNESPHRVTESLQENSNNDKEQGFSGVGNTHVTGTKSKSVTGNVGRNSYNLRPRGGIYIPREDCEGYLPETPTRHWTKGGEPNGDKKGKSKCHADVDKSRDTSPDVEMGAKSQGRGSTAHSDHTHHNTNQTDEIDWRYSPYINSRNLPQTEISHKQIHHDKSNAKPGHERSQLRDQENAHSLSG